MVTDADAAADGLQKQLVPVLYREFGDVSYHDARRAAAALMPMVEAYIAAQVAAAEERIVVKIRKQADRYFTPGCDQDDHTYGHGLRFAAHLIEEKDLPREEHNS